jgi:hypothetical protein
MHRNASLRLLLPQRYSLNFIIIVVGINYRSCFLVLFSLFEMTIIKK